MPKTNMLIHRNYTLPTSRAILGITRNGTCRLLAPKTRDAQTLTVTERQAFLRDLHNLGAAITAVYRPIRISYQLQDQAGDGLSALVIPWYATGNGTVEARISGNQPI